MNPACASDACQRAHDCRNADEALLRRDQAISRATPRGVRHDASSHGPSCHDDGCATYLQVDDVMYPQADDATCPREDGATYLLVDGPTYPPAGFRDALCRDVSKDAS